MLAPFTVTPVFKLQIAPPLLRPCCLWLWTIDPVLPTVTLLGASSKSAAVPAPRCVVRERDVAPFTVIACFERLRRHPAAVLLVMETVDPVLPTVTLLEPSKIAPPLPSRHVVRKRDVRPFTVTELF